MLEVGGIKGRERMKEGKKKIRGKENKELSYPEK